MIRGTRHLEADGAVKRVAAQAAALVVTSGLTEKQQTAHEAIKSVCVLAIRDLHSVKANRVFQSEQELTNCGFQKELAGPTEPLFQNRNDGSDFVRKEAMTTVYRLS